VGKAAIELTGNDTDETIVADEFMEPTRKTLIVTGTLNVYG
jgi:hypothetical protein